MGTYRSGGLAAIKTASSFWAFARKVVAMIIALMCLRAWIICTKINLFAFVTVNEIEEKKITRKMKSTIKLNMRQWNCIFFRLTFCLIHSATMLCFLKDMSVKYFDWKICPMNISIWKIFTIELKNVWHVSQKQ